MRKMPLFVAAGILIFVGLAFYTAGQINFYNTDFLSKRVLQKETQIKIYSELAKRIVLAKQLDDLDPLLKNAYEIGNFDWVILSFEGSAILTLPEEVRDWNIKQIPGQIIVNDPKLSLITTDLGQGLVLTLGVNKDPSVFLKNRVIKDWRVVVQDLTIPLAIAIAVFLYFLKDILRLVRTLKAPAPQQAISKLDAMHATTQEASVLIAGFKGFSQEIEKLTTDRAILFNQVLPSMRKELFSGVKPPYDFEATLVRLDINHFSELFQKCNRLKLLGCINQLFEVITLLVSRHGGYVHEFVGDEVLFYFKGPQEESAKTALWCLRDIDEYVNSEFVSIAKEAIGQELHFKASFASGELHFGPLVDGFSLAGSILIESVRILSQVQSREGNIIVYDDRHSSILPEGFTGNSMKTATLKGLGIESHIMQLHKLPGYESSRKWKFLLNSHIYRTIHDLRQIFLQSEDTELSREAKSIGEISLVLCDEKIQQEILHWIKEVIDLKQVSDQKMSILLSFVKVIRYNQNFQKDISNVVYSRLESLGPRSAANAIEVLALQENFQFEGLLREISKRAEPRLLANALVLASQRLHSDLWITTLEKMLQSKRSSERASGVFAVGEIAYLFARQNPLALKTNLVFQDMMRQVPSFLVDKDEHVKNQAIKALEKIKVFEQRTAA